MPKAISVNMGDLAFGKSGETLSAILGSCVGIGVLCDRTGQIALAHCVLPGGPHHRTHAHPVQYMIHTIPLIQKEFGLTTAELRHLRFAIAGGARMGDFDHPFLRIGELNIEMCQKILKEISVKPELWDVGGTQGRKLTLFQKTMTYAVDFIPKWEEAA